MKNTTWFEWALALLPLVNIPLGLGWWKNGGGDLYQIGGFFWMGIGLAAALLNIALFRSKLSGLTKYVVCGIVLVLSLAFGFVSAVILYGVAGGSL